MHITLNTKWDLEDLVALRSLYHRQTCSPLLRYLAHFSVILMIGVAIFAMKDGHFTMSVISTGAIICYFIYIRTPLSPFFDRRHYKKVRDKLISSRWEFLDDKITVSNKLANSEVKWEAFSRVVIHPKAIFLYGSSSEPCFIRNEYFENEGDYLSLIHI